MSGNDVTFWDSVDRIRESEGRYRREAYGFVVAALGRTVEDLPAERRDDPDRRHLTGRELLDGVVRLARREFGVLAATVFREWGVVGSEDVGRIVFALVESGQLAARPEDRIDDFRDGEDLLRALGDALEPGEDLPGRRLKGARRADG